MGNSLQDIHLEGYAPLEVTLKASDDFLKIRETLTRIGVASRKDKILYHSCHILHKLGLFYLVHFKEMLALDGKEIDMSLNDVQRRNTIAGLLEDWNVLTIVSYVVLEKAPLSQIKVLSFKEKSDWTCVAKYQIGSKS